MTRRRARLVLALVLATLPGAARGVAGEAASAGRVLALLRGAAEEYREALDDAGRVVRPLEIEEAELLIAEARDHGARLPAPVAGEVARGLDGIAAAIAARAPLAQVDAAVDGLRAAVSAATGVAEEVFPPAPPSAARGAAVYAAHCTTCHGEHGAGDGPSAAALERKPANFGDATFMRGETPVDFFNVISVGKRRSAMPAWENVLGVQERWDVIAHIWAFATRPAAQASGQGLFVAHCAGCHGAAGDGRGPYAAALPAPPPDLTRPERLAERTDADLYQVVTAGVAGTTMPGFVHVLDEDERREVAAFVRTLSLGGGRARGAERAGDAAGAGGTGQALVNVRALLAQAADAHRRGDPAATDLATDAYSRFEPVERELGARDPSLVQRVEEAFLRLRGTLRRPDADVAPLFAAVGRELDAAEAALASPADAWARFAQSLTIILREGFEVVLILGALLAWVVRTGNTRMRRPIYAGAALGLVASLATAALLVTVLRLTPGIGELLEGIAMLLAAVVLFSVSYWIISKAEAEHWQRYIRGKVERAVATGSGTALATAAFLAVYREGFETVLFYQALAGTAPAGDLMVPAGFVAGLALLGVVYLGLARFGVRIPIRPFFLATGALLYAMAVVFAGKGVHELQEAGVVSVTAVAGPSVALLGIYPTVQTLIAQGILLALVVGGLVVTFVRRPHRDEGEHAQLRAEVQRLRAVAEALEHEVESLRTPEAEAVGRRLRGLIGEVRALEERVASLNGRG